MDSMLAWCFKVANLRLILGMCAIYLVFPLLLLPQVINSGSVGPLDLLLWYNHDTLYQMLSAYGEAIRTRYIMGLLTVDLAYPIYYGTLLSMIMAVIIKKLTIPCPQKIILIPYIVVLFDLTENGFLIFLLSAYPKQHNHIADTVGFITAIKWSIFFSVAVLLIYLVGRGLHHRKKSQSGNN
ncbi:hypothetical protein [uncultured Paraglaciecola sp.]|uniref:hypothetical protein n=1 Tax=uncultured Paraglaciecola sp. TaxID=1765024 RepID=UPI0026207932|nr:hypothetical protein [uncultured Paraglaciecola sp.]